MTGVQTCALPISFVRDEKQKVKDVLGEAKIVRFARYAVGG